MMSPEERQKSGVDTLTAEQRQFLSEWLLENYTRNPAKVVSSPATAPDTSPQQAASNEATADTIEAEIDRRVRHDWRIIVRVRKSQPVTHLLRQG